MADPCVDNTPSIEIDVTGTPGVLTAFKRNHDTSWSGTLGDDTKHDVNDTGVTHTLSGGSFTIDNGPNGDPTASAVDQVQGIIVVALNPIWVFATDPVTIVPFARLTVDSVVQDERDISALGVDLPAGTSQLLALGSLVSQFDIPLLSSIPVDVLYTVKNIGASGQWSFRFGGSKLVANLGY
jgi:hypothetical protein